MECVWADPLFSRPPVLLSEHGREGASVGQRRALSSGEPASGRPAHSLYFPPLATRTFSRLRLEPAVQLLWGPITTPPFPLSFPVPSTHPHTSLGTSSRTSRGLCRGAPCSRSLTPVSAVFLLVSSSSEPKPCSPRPLLSAGGVLCDIQPVAAWTAGSSRALLWPVSCELSRARGRCGDSLRLAARPSRLLPQVPAAVHLTDRQLL